MSAYQWNYKQTRNKGKEHQVQLSYWISLIQVLGIMSIQAKYVDYPTKYIPIVLFSVSTALWTLYPTSMPIRPFCNKRESGSVLDICLSGWAYTASSRSFNCAISSFRLASFSFKSGTLSSWLH